jgi:hypothetical protein
VSVGKRLRFHPATRAIISSTLPLAISAWPCQFPPKLAQREPSCLEHLGRRSSEGWASKSVSRDAAHTLPDADLPGPNSTAILVRPLLGFA